MTLAGERIPRYAQSTCVFRINKSVHLRCFVFLTSIKTNRNIIQLKKKRSFHQVRVGNYVSYREELAIVVFFSVRIVESNIYRD